MSQMYSTLPSLFCTACLRVHPCLVSIPFTGPSLLEMELCDEYDIDVVGGRDLETIRT